MSETDFDRALQWFESRDGGFERAPSGGVRVYVEGPEHVKASHRRRYGDRAFPSRWWKVSVDHPGGFKEAFVAAITRLRGEVEEAERFPSLPSSTDTGDGG